MSYTNEIRNEAIRLRTNGESYKRIGKLLNMSPSTVWLWTKNIQLSQQSKDILRKNQYDAIGRSVSARYRNIRKKWFDYGYRSANYDILHLQGCMLYWAEGAKNSVTLCFTNTCPEMIKLFIKFLKRFYLVKNHDICLSIQYHEGGRSTSEMQNFWIDYLDISGCKKYKPICKSKYHVPVHKHPNGICTIRVHNVKIMQQIWGSINKYTGYIPQDVL